MEKLTILDQARIEEWQQSLSGPPSLRRGSHTVNQNYLKKFHGEETLRVSTAADKFCNACFSFLSTKQWHYKDENRSETSRVFHSGFSSLQHSSATGCHLCCLLESRIATTTLYPSFQGTPKAEISSAQSSEKENVKLQSSSPIYLSAAGDSEKIVFLWIWTQLHDTPGSQFKFISNLRLYGNDEISAHALKGIKQQRMFLQDSTSPKSASKRILDWVTVCAGSHNLCNSYRREKGKYQMPTRLLDVSRMHSHGHVTVVKSSTLDRDSQYITLSHRWGTNPTITLNDDTEASLTAGSSLDKFPTLFQDACQLVYKLGVSYLWIDALCIKQSDPADWEQEASRMTFVFLNSYVNIVAGHSFHQDSLFSSRKPLSQTPCIISLSPLSESLKIFAVGDPTNARPSDQIGTMITESRGWILQECLLARGIVYFGHGEILWRCSTTTETEESSSNLHGPHGHRTHHDSTKELLAHFARGDDDDFRTAEFLSTWQTIVEEYTRRDLTDEGDRLVAIAGVAEFLQNIAQGRLGRYFAGLWERGFERQLCWTVGYPFSISHSATYLAPSWSWATLRNGVSPANIEQGISWSSFIEDLDVGVESFPTEFTKVKHGYFSVTANLCEASLNVQAKIPNLTIHLRGESQDVQAVDLQTINRFEVTDQEELRNVPLFIMPLLFEDESRDSCIDCSAPMARRLLTDWRPHCAADERVPNSQPVNPAKLNRPQYPWEGSLRYSVYALILLKAGTARGEFRRIGCTQVYSDGRHVSNLRQACHEADLAEDIYIERYPARCGYHIKVV